jgi:hypothetical protein
MFISWGTKVASKRLGRVADFCPICRGVRPFDVRKLDKFDHLYGIPVSHRGTVGFIKRCEACSIELNEESDAHESYSRDGRADVAALMATAGPRLRERMRDRLALERRALEGALTTEDRSTLLVEPFLCLNPWADDRGRVKEKDRAGALCFLGVFVLPLLVLGLSEATRLVPVDVEWKAAMATGIALLLATLYLRVTVHGRYARRVLIPRLAQTLRPLRPSAEELERTVDLLRQKRLRIGKSVNSMALLDAILNPIR